MASAAASAAALFLAVNILLFNLQVAASTPCPPPPPPKVPTPCPPTPSGGGGKCPRDTLKLGVCADVLGLIKAKAGPPPRVPCCSLLEGLAELEAAVCLCSAIKANVLGINLDLPVDLTLILNYCGKGVPYGFKC